MMFLHIHVRGTDPPSSSIGEVSSIQTTSQQASLFSSLPMLLPAPDLRFPANGTGHFCSSQIERKRQMKRPSRIRPGSVPMCSSRREPLCYALILHLPPEQWIVPDFSHPGAELRLGSSRWAEEQQAK